MIMETIKQQITEQKYLEAVEVKWSDGDGTHSFLTTPTEATKFVRSQQEEMHKYYAECLPACTLLYEYRTVLYKDGQSVEVTPETIPDFKDVYEAIMKLGLAVHVLMCADEVLAFNLGISEEAFTEGIDKAKQLAKVPVKALPTTITMQPTCVDVSKLIAVISDPGKVVAGYTFKGYDDAVRIALEYIRDHDISIYDTKMYALPSDGSMSRVITPTASQLDKWYQNPPALGQGKILK